MLIAKVMFDITYDTKNSIKKYVQMFEKKSKEKKEKIIADINLSQLVARIFCKIALITLWNKKITYNLLGNVTIVTSV